MQRQLTYGLVAGFTAALMFAIVAAWPTATGALIYFLLPLPIFVAGLAARWQSAAIGLLAATAALSALVGPPAAIAVVTTQLAPAAFLTYLVQLYRDDAPAAPSPVPVNRTPAGTPTPTRQWYPVGQIVIWATAIAVIIAIVLVAAMFADLDKLKSLMRTNLDALIDAGLPKGTKNEDVTEAHRVDLVNTMIQIMPAAFAIATSVTFLANFWLAGRITHAANILNRPWPDLAAITYPLGTAIALAASFIAASTLTGVPGTAAAAIAGGLFFAYVLMGLAIIHHVTRKSPWRTAILTTLYVSFIVLNSAFWTLLAIIALAEPISPLRRNFDAAPPPTKPT